MITLFMILHRVLPRGMDGCFPQNYFMYFSYFIFMFNDFSDAFVFRRGGSLRWISKIFNQLIFSLSSGLFFFPVYYCICGTFPLSWLKYCDPNVCKLEYFTHLLMYVLRFMYDCIVLTNNTFIFLWHYKWIYILYPICLCLYDDVFQSTFLSMASFHNLYFVNKKLVCTYILSSCINVKMS